MEIIAKRLELSPVGSQVDRGVWTPTRTTRRPTDISLATIEDSKGLEALGPEWSSLFEACGKPHQVFQTFEWLSIWASLYVDDQTRLSIVTGRINGHLVFVWPLLVRKTFGLRILSQMGEPLTQYSDALMATELDDAAADAALDYILALPVDVIAFRRVRDDAAMSPLLNRRWGESVNRQASPYVEFTGTKTIEAFEKRFSGKLRASRRRRRRRLEERGALTFTHHASSPEAAVLVSVALGFKRDWARQVGVLAPSLRDPRFEQFFIAAASAGPKAPDLRVSVLRSGADILGVEISVACKGQIFGHVLAPRPGFGALGLGGVLAEQILHNALEQGYAAVDLLAPADPYKLEWTSSVVGVGDHCISLTLYGALYTRLWLRFGRAALKAIVGRLQPGLAALTRRFRPI